MKSIIHILTLFFIIGLATESQSNAENVVKTGRSRAAGPLSKNNIHFYYYPQHPVKTSKPYAVKGPVFKNQKGKKAKKDTTHSETKSIKTQEHHLTGPMYKNHRPTMHTIK